MGNNVLNSMAVMAPKWLFFATKTGMERSHCLRYGSAMAHLLPIDVPFIMEKKFLQLETPTWRSSLRPEFSGRNGKKMAKIDHF